MKEFQSPAVHGSLSSWDDFCVHQTAETVRHVATSDRNFYDRYYFNCHANDGRAFLIFGLGQYPNLEVQDAFACVVVGDQHEVVRSSRRLGDRMDTSVGPLRVEVIAPLERLRIVCEPTADSPISFDLEWTGSMPAFEEPRQYLRRHGRVLFDTMRLAQTGRWSGVLRTADGEFDVVPDSWWGTRDRSWGVRPVGEEEPAGVRTEGQMTGMWNYAPMQFDDHSLLYILNEHDAAGSDPASVPERPLEEAVRIWHDPSRAPEWLGRPEHECVIRSGTRYVERSTLHFPEAPGGAFSVSIEPLLDCWLMHGTGYGIDPDWRHGMWQGELVVQTRRMDYTTQAAELFGLCDQVARCTQSGGPADGAVGHGLHEFFFIGNFERYGLRDWDPAP